MQTIQTLIVFASLTSHPPSCACIPCLQAVAPHKHMSFATIWATSRATERTKRLLGSPCFESSVSMTECQILPCPLEREASHLSKQPSAVAQELMNMRPK